MMKFIASYAVYVFIASFILALFSTYLIRWLLITIAAKRHQSKTPLKV
ncbi:hypothetical protein [Bacillus taeanensis]|nr:hypothetical protein [Bacillus taeanensis]